MKRQNTFSGLAKMTQNSDYILLLKNKAYNLSARTHVMGILNCTPDSFSDGGLYETLDQYVFRAEQMAEQGADFIDVGGESTRPGAEEVSSEEETERIVPVIEKICKNIDIPVSADTRKAEVARAAINAGAAMVNDVSGLKFDSQMPDVIVKARVPVIIMHMRATPKTMQNNTEYHDLIGQIIDELKESAALAEKAGISRKNMIIDPGIGFGKKMPDNFRVIKHLKRFSELNCPVLVGLSRKSFLGWALDAPVYDRLAGSIAAAAAAVMNGAHILRVHDVKETVQAVKTADLIVNADQMKAGKI